MSSKKIKLLESAQKNFLKGLYDKAVSDYRQIIQLDPVDIRHRQRLAEILTKANQKDEAIKEYSSLAKHYVDAVHYLKAIAVYKQIQKLDPTNPDISLTLASLNEKQGLIGNASTEYASAIHIFEANGENLKALKALESMLAIDPNNFAVRLRLADKLFTIGREERSAEEFVSLARDLQERSDENGFQHVSDKINALFKGDAAVLFKQINATSETTVQESSVAEISEQIIEQQQPAVPFLPAEVPLAATEAAPEPAAVLDAEDDIELIEDLEYIEELEELDELVELDTLLAPQEETDWEEEIDLDTFIAMPVISAETPEEIDSFSSQETDSELEDIELELEIDDGEQLTEPLSVGSDDSFDLGRELSVFADEIDFDLFRSDSRFELDSPSGFKRNELDNEDTESHYSLGLAYKEMGLFDEAISEFIVASRSAARKVDCLILQGVCFREIGELAKAVEIFADTLKLPELNEDEILGIKYELALCHELVDEPVQAKQLYREILIVRPDFSDTAARISRL